MDSWTSTGYFINSTGSFVISSRVICIHCFASWKFRVGLDCGSLLKLLYNPKSSILLDREWKFYTSVEVQSVGKWIGVMCQHFHVKFCWSQPKKIFHSIWETKVLVLGFNFESKRWGPWSLHDEVLWTSGS